MTNRTSDSHGIELLVKKCRSDFRCPENTNHYSESDYLEAERKYVKFCLHGDPDA
jgi:hypothetical protein